ncbi:Dabb family protein [Larkinella insperata]|uniref:Dabb family protein n=1 Tax=Larkinella insperata TaxID=332158 RepID=A0ABW3QLQ5_9BACT
MHSHFGVFQFKGTVTEEQIVPCFNTLQEMVGRIPGLLKLEHGPYDSPEGLNDSFTHGFVMTFDSLVPRAPTCLIPCRSM